MSISNYIKSSDWKAEKHVPVITVEGRFVSGQPLDIEVSVGKEIPHPNTIEHHIAWIALYYVPEGAPFPIELARADFSAHGPGVFTEPVLKTTVRLPSPTPIQNPKASGKLLAVAYCNLHGLWEGEMTTEVL